MISGSLEREPFAVVLAKVVSECDNGTLLLTKDVLGKKIYFANKRIFFAESTDENELLPNFLKQKGIIKDEVINYINDVSKNIYLFPSVALDLQVIEEEMLLKELQEYCNYLIAPLFQWDKGVYYYQELEEKQSPPILVQLPVHQIILEGCRSITHFDFLNKIFNDYSVKPHLKEGSWEKLILIKPNPQESFLLSRIDGEFTIEDLINMCPFSENETLAALYAFYACDIVDLKKSVGRIYRLGTDASEMFASTEDTKSKTSDAFFEMYSEIDKKYKEILSLNYYEVLDVSENSDASKIKSSYYQLAKKYHPDKYSTIIDAVTKEKLSFIFSKLTEAYQTLENNREAYDAKLRELRTPKQYVAPKVTAKMDFDKAKIEHEIVAEEKEIVTDPVKAEQLLEKGKMTFILGHYLEGIRLFKEAALYNPDNPEILRILGKNMVRYPEWRKEAEGYLDRAIKLEPNNPENYYELGNLYSRYKLFYKARAQYWHSLKLDPNHKDTLQALSDLPLDVKFPEEQKRDIFSRMKENIFKLLRK